MKRNFFQNGSKIQPILAQLNQPKVYKGFLHFTSLFICVIVGLG